MDVQISGVFNKYKINKKALPSMSLRLQKNTEVDVDNTKIENVSTV